MTVLIILINCALLLEVIIFFYKKFTPTSSLLFFSALLVKLVAAFALGFIYTYYYSRATDTWSYFEIACQLAEIAKKDWSEYLNLLFTSQHVDSVGHLLYVEDRTSFFVKIVSLLCLMGGNNYWICAAYFSVISFMSAWYLYCQLTSWKGEVTTASALSLFFLPSVALWGSGLIKETLALSGLYYLTAIFIRFARGLKLNAINYLLSVFALSIAWLFKYYWLAAYLSVLVPSIILVFIIKKKSYSTLQTLLIWVACFLVIGILATFAHPNFYMDRILQVIVENNERYMRISASDNLIHFNQLSATWLSILVNSPLAFISGLFRPFIWEASGLTSLALGVENFILAIIGTGWCFGKRTQSDWRVVFFIFIYVSVLCVFLSLSTPNFGTLSRYRIGFLPFFVFAISWCNPLLDYFAKGIFFAGNHPTN